MNTLLLMSCLMLGQLELKTGDKVLRLSSEGLALKTGGKEVVLSGAGLKGTVDGGVAFTGIGQTKNHACADGENVDVGGTNNRIYLTGNCGAVTVAGLGVYVNLETAASISLSGKNNAVVWKRGDPKLEKSGSGNELLHVK